MSAERERWRAAQIAIVRRHIHELAEAIEFGMALPGDEKRLALAREWRDILWRMDTADDTAPLPRPPAGY